jgi:DNA ligase-associated metallophosphoesterase
MRATTGEVNSITLGGATLQPLHCGALWWETEKTLIVADLHFEKGTSRRVSANGLPPYDTVETLSRLKHAIEETRARRIVSLGDAFHDEEGPARLDSHLREAFTHLMRAHEWVWIAGNHDGAAAAAVFGGQAMGELALGRVLLRHEAEPHVPDGFAELSGHYHPKAAVAIRGRRVSASCFVHDARRLILPAFGAYTGGLNVFDPAIRRWFGAGFSLHLRGRTRLFHFTAATDAAD